MKEWSKLNRKDLMNLYQQMSGPKIAKLYGVHHNTVYERFKVLGVTKPRRSFVPDRDELQSLYQTMSMADIAKHYGVGETVVFKRLKEYGIGGISRKDRLTGKPKSLEHRIAMSRSAIASGVRAGSKNGNWQGGKTSPAKAARSRAAYHEWKRAVFEKADWKCQKCGAEHSSICDHCGHRIVLHAHHVQPFAEDHSLRYDVSNGVALCERCHMLEHHN